VQTQLSKIGANPRLNLAAFDLIAQSIIFSMVWGWLAEPFHRPF
jgi:hypothetical protein